MTIRLPERSWYDPESDGLEPTDYGLPAGALCEAELAEPPPPRSRDLRARSSREEIPEDAVLGPIVADPALDMSKVLRLAAGVLPSSVDPDEFRKAVSALSDPVVLRDFVLLPEAGAAASDRRARQPVSSIPPGVMIQLQPICRRAPMQTGKLNRDVPIARLKLVEKRGDSTVLLWRVILACLSFNDRCRKPPRTPLPHLRELIYALMGASWAARLDFRSWFYQFRLSLAVALMGFRWRWRGDHGEPEEWMFLRMAMGWTWSVYIATTTALVILRAGSLEGGGTPTVTFEETVWVDDGAAWDVNHDRLERRWNGVLRVAKRVGAELKEFTPRPVQQFRLVGLDFDLEKGRWRLAPQWVTTFRAQIVAAQASSAISLRICWRLTGAAVWAAYAAWLPYSVLWPALWTIRAALPACGRTPNDKELEAPVAVSRAAWAGLRAIAAVADRWRKLPSPPVAIMPLATDASVVGAGIVFTCARVSRPWSNGATLTGRDQQRLELTAAVDAVITVAKGEAAVPPPPRGTRVLLWVDNTGLAWRIARWQTAGAESPLITRLWNALAARGWTLTVGCVPGDETPADAPSRSAEAYVRREAYAFGALCTGGMPGAYLLPVLAAPTSVIVNDDE